MTTLPPSSTPLERAIDAAADRALPVLAGGLWHPATCPEAALPWLAWALHITDGEGWKLATTVAQQRALIARSFALHRKKGTPWSIREALRQIGFNDAEVAERLPIERYDGAITHSGAGSYNAYGWAQFRLTADVGDEQPINASQTQRITEAVNEWKPARSHLVDVQYRAGVTEAVPSSESTQTAGAVTQEDAHRWGRRLYDGSLSHNHGLLRTHEGAFAFSGACDYSGFTAAGERYDAAREAAEMAGSLVLADQQLRSAGFDGFGDYGGSLDFGASAPVAEDLPMPITLTRHRRYDGRHAFAAHIHAGADRYNGARTYFGNIPFAGDVATTLEA